MPFWTKLTLCLVILTGLPRSLFATKGFALLENDAQSTAMHGGATALNEGPSAARYNSANLSYVHATTVGNTFTVYDVGTSFTSPAGLSTSSNHPIKPLGALFVAVPLNPATTLGIGVDGSYGLSCDFDPQSPFKYVAPYYANMRMVNLVTALGYKASDNVRLGLELDMFHASLRLKQLYPWLLVTGNRATPDGLAESEATDICPSGGLSITWTPSPSQRWSLVAHTQTAVRLEGDFTLSNIPAPIPGVSARTDFTGTLTMPADITLSYAAHLSPTTTVGAEIEWIGNYVADKIAYDVRGNNVLFPSTDTVLNWKNSVVLSAGIRQRVSPQLVLSGGYQYSESPGNSRNYLPLIPGNNRHLFSAGFGYTEGRFTLHCSYNYGWQRDLRISDNQVSAFNGTHSFHAQIFMASAGWRF